MKNIKSFKLFESFKSDKLSKTLAFINKESKTKFLEQLKTIAKKIDLPYSEYTDDYFQYLPFKKALQLNQNIDDIPCDAKSIDVFPEHSVAGAVCGGAGKIDRIWGKTIRNVVCPVCSGTGVKPQTTFDIKWIKFWFSKDGQHVSTTATDGEIRTQSTTINFYSDSNVDWSRNIDDYVETSTLTLREIHTLPTGSYIKISLKDSSRTESLVCRIFRADSSSSRTYVLQDSFDGSEPDFGDWRSFASKSWVLHSGGEYTGLPKLLVPKSKFVQSEISTESNPYEWNNLLNLARMTISNDSNMNRLLSNAHFALVLNYLDLVKSEYTKGQKVRDERQENKRGAISLLNADDIKTENIERYLDTISKNLRIPTDLSNIDLQLKRILGYSQIGYYILRGRNMSELDSFITSLYKFMSEKDEARIAMHLKSCKSILDSILRLNVDFNREVSMSIVEIKRTLNDSSKEYLKPVLVAIEDLNVFMTELIKNYKIETFEDIESLVTVCKSIRDVWKNSDRFGLRDIYYSVENIKGSRRFMSYFEDINQSDVESCLNDIERFKKVVSRLLN